MTYDRGSRLSDGAVQSHGGDLGMPVGRVLVVDDQPQVAVMFREVLTNLGYEGEIALSGPDALRLVPTFRPDVVLLDLSMPGMSGAEVFAYLRGANPDLPVIIVTGNADMALARDTLAPGAFDYIQKPFNIEILARTVAAALRQREG